MLGTRLFVISVIIVPTIIESPVSTFTIRHKRDALQSDNVFPVQTDDGLVTSTSVSDNSEVSYTRESDQNPLDKFTPTQTSVKIYEIKGESLPNDKVELTTAFILLKSDNGYLKITGLPIYTTPINDESTNTDPKSYLPYDTTEITRERRQKLFLNQAMTAAINADATTVDEDKSKFTTDITRNESITTNAPNEMTSTENPNTGIISPIQTIVPTSLSEPTGGNTLTNSASSTPSWKKYTTIDRKRESTAAQSMLTTENVQSDTSPTRVSFEKLLSESLPSPVKTGEINPPGEIDQFSTVEYYEPITAEYASLNIKESPPRTLHLTSMRAGFLDYSAKPVAEEETTVVENVDSLKNNTKKDTSELLIDKQVEISDGDKSYTHLESRNQLAENALNVELLKEEIFENSEKNSKRNKEGSNETGITRSISDNNRLNTPSGLESAGYPSLAVKPIEKNASLYSMSANNYKPLKKIEVQSLKPLVRNPDDNSWRNESISSLGIVFKAKSPSKNYTQVLKNKTETLFNNSTDKDNKSGVPDLRERLEKIAEVRKSKKKKVIDKYGEAVYADYEENASSAETTSASTPLLQTTVAKPSAINGIGSNDREVNVYSSIPEPHLYKNNEFVAITTAKPKYNHILEYYDTTDEYDADYANLPKIDLKKFTALLTTKEVPATTVTVPEPRGTRPTQHAELDRRPTLQYFPPRTTQKINEYEGDQRKLNYYTYQENKNPLPLTFSTAVSPQRKLEQPQRQKIIHQNEFYKVGEDDKTVYVAQRPVQPPPTLYEEPGERNFHRNTFIIKQYNFDEAVNGADYDKKIDYEPRYTHAPLRGATANELASVKAQFDDEDYDTQYRKAILSRFVDNFNQNSERFKVDFPILYNNSVVHRGVEHGSAATSSAFVKRLYTNAERLARPCGSCDNLTVELSPAYELHYYVPEQEERAEVDPRTSTSLPYRYLSRL